MSIVVKIKIVIGLTMLISMVLEVGLQLVLFSNDRYTDSRYEHMHQSWKSGISIANKYGKVVPEPPGMTVR